MISLFKQDASERREMILNGDIMTTLLLLSGPVLLMGVIQALVPLSDALFLNRILGPKIASAISYSQSSINIMLAISQGLGVTAMAMIGQMNGKGDIKGVNKISIQVFVFGLIFGIFLIPVCIALAFVISKTAPIELRANVFLYISLFSSVIPFNFMASIFNSIKQATGNPEAAFFRMVVLLILKIIFNFIFLYFLKLGIKGSIFATLCSYLITAVWMYYDLFVKDYIYKLSLKGYRFDFKIIRELVKLGIPSMLSFMMINLGFLLINMEVAKYGTTILSGLGIASQINNICYILPSAVATIVTTMISMNMGLNKTVKAKQVYKKGLYMGLVITTILLVIILMLSKYLTRTFTKDVDVLRVANEALELYTYSILPYSVFVICQAVFYGLGKSVYPLIMGFLRVWAFRYIFILLTQSFLGYYSVFYGNLFSNFLAAGIFYLLVKNLKWESSIKYED